MCFIKYTLVKYFPSYKFNDASNRNKNEMNKILELCENIDNLIVYMTRNQKNDNVFKEFAERVNIKIGIIFCVKTFYLL